MTKLISINNTELKNVVAFSATHKKNVITEKDAKGNTHISILSKKWEIDITFGRMNASETSLLLGLISGYTFEVEFYDSETATLVTFTAYETDRSFKLIEPDENGGYITEGSIKISEL